MRLRVYRTGSSRRFVHSVLAVSAFASLLLPGNRSLVAQTTEQAPVPTEAAAKIPADQLDALVAPIALYPDPLLSQTLVASTYPLELIQLHQWLLKNNDIKDQKKLAEKVAKQPWDPSIQAMAPLPTVVKWLAEDIQYTTDLGNAFLAQQADVMEAVQRMRAKAKDKGALASNEQQKVETTVVETKQVIVIEQANPQVVYVPSYNPTYVYGTIGYPYPPIYYPPYYGTGAVIAAGAISFGVGVAIGAAWGNGGWGWGCGWGGNDINVNINNNFNRNYNNIHGGNRVNNINNIQGGNRVNQGGGKWQHNAAHRGGAPYGDRSTADRFGGAARGDSLANRQSGARNQLGRQGNQLPSTRDTNRGGGSGNRAGVGDRSSGIGSAPGNRGGGISDRSSGGNRSGGLSGGNRGAGISDRSSGGGFGGNRSSSGGGFGGNRSSSGGGFGGNSSSNRMSSSGGNRGGFGGGGYSGSSARSSSSRGMSSMGGSRGGGMSRGGGGGMRGGGGRRR